MRSCERRCENTPPLCQRFYAEQRAPQIGDTVRAHAELLPVILRSAGPTACGNEPEDLERDGEVMVRMIEFDATEPIRRLK